jgi:hypothetical protein
MLVCMGVRWHPSAGSRRVSMPSDADVYVLDADYYANAGVYAL